MQQFCPSSFYLSALPKKGLRKTNVKNTSWKTDLLVVEGKKAVELRFYKPECLVSVI